MTILKLRIVSAEGLIAVDTHIASNSSSDPYCRITCGEETFKTNVVKSSLSPTWNESFTLGETQLLDNKTKIELRVKDHNSFSTNLDLGTAILTLENVTKNEWNTLTIPLTIVKGMTKVSGSIKVQVLYEVSEQSETLSNAMLSPTSAPTATQGTAPAPDLNSDPTPNIWSSSSSVSTSSSNIPTSTKLPTIPSSETEPTPANTLPYEPPNFIVVSILEGSNLKGCDKNETTSDPFVKIRCVSDSTSATTSSTSTKSSKNKGSYSKTYQTKVCHKTLNPKWRQKFYFDYHPEESTSLELRVEDEDLLSNDFMGQLHINIKDWCKLYAAPTGATQAEWYALQPANATFADLSETRSLKLGYGKILLSIQLCYLNYTIEHIEQGAYDPDMYNECSAGEKDGEGETEEDGNGSGSKEDDVNFVRSGESAEERGKRLKEEEAKFEELQNVDFKSGDYQIQVRILEVRDLKPQDANGSCDPVVFVECFNEKQNTKVKTKQLSCVFDEVLSFNFTEMKKEDIECGSIEIIVMDADGPSALLQSVNKNLAQKCNDVIGTFRIDVPYVYYQKDHEMYRQWVALVSNAAGNDGVQGYLLLSVSVLGPGDKIKIHNAEKEDQDVLSNISSQVNQMVLMPPRVTQKLYFLIVTVHEACDLPDMDGGLLKTGGIDAFVRVEFASTTPLETKKETRKGFKDLDVAFNQELWFPVLLPCMTNLIKVSIWDWDRTKDEIVATTKPFYFNHIQQNPNLYQKTWTYLYGAPKSTEFITLNTVSQQYMNTHPDEGSTYRGKLLLSFRIESTTAASSTSSASSSRIEIPHTRNILKVEPPRTEQYILRAHLISGTEIPQFTSRTHWGTNSKMSLQVCIGKHVLSSSRVSNTNGVCTWNEYLEQIASFPALKHQIPDIFVYLVKGNIATSKRICYARFKASDILINELNLLPENGGNTTSKDNNAVLIELPKAKWINMQPDKVYNELKDGLFGGHLCLRLSLSLITSNEKVNLITKYYKQEALNSMRLAHYSLLVHTFQGKNLLPSDANGLLDPYLLIYCSGQVKKSQVKYQTRDPCYYETFQLDLDLPIVDEFKPSIAIQIYDYDQWDADDHVGNLNIPLQGVPTITSTVYKDKVKEKVYQYPEPTWYEVFFDQPGDSEGEILFSFELVRKMQPNEQIEVPFSIRPKMEDKFLEIICLGCRGLNPLGFMPIHLPFVQFEIGEISKSNRPKLTSTSSKPSSENPNFCERIIIPVQIPENALFAPRLHVSVYDTLLGGFHKPLLGTCSIDLTSKIPYSNHQPNPRYIAPGESTLYNQGNPYVEIKADVSTFPGKKPTEVVVGTSSTTNAAAGAATTTTTESSMDSGSGVASMLSTAASSPAISEQGLVNPELDILSAIDTDEDIPEYLKHREIRNEPIEAELKSTPFEVYTLFRGRKSKKHSNRNKHSNNTYHSVGTFKGMIRFLNSRTDPSLISLDHFLVPKPYIVRVYVLDAFHLQPKDSNNKSDPYLRVQIGDTKQNLRANVINDRQRYHKETLHPKFHSLYEFKTTLPGASVMKIDCLDYDGFSATNFTLSDDFIGSTTMDLEDRLFDSRWQALDGQLNLTNDSTTSSIVDGSCGSSTYKHKPIETRCLYTPSSTISQGNIRLWVDILTPQEADVYKALNIALPPAEVFEVRVIVYKAKDVIPGDTISELSDLYAKCWLQNRNDQFQSTDIHWRARDNKASFNWRMKFDINLPLNADNEEEKGYLHVQLWDKDLLYDDCLSDTIINLEQHLKDAYKTKRTIQVFGTNKNNTNSSNKRSKQPKRIMPNNGTVAAAVKDDTEGDNPLTSHNFVETTGQDDLENGVRQPLLKPTVSSTSTTASAMNSKELKLKKAVKKKQNVDMMIKSLKHRFGLSDEDPEHTNWLTCTTRDPHTGDRIEAGKVLIGVEILPKHIANEKAAGLGRSEPNNFPYLPEPADRLNLHAMWNPFYVLESLIGPKNYTTCTRIMFSIVLIGFVIFAGPLIEVFVTFMNMIPPPYGFIVFGVCMLVLLVSIACISYKCRRALRTSS